MPHEFDDAMLMAFGDGVLEEPEFSAVAEAVEQDHALAARLEALREGRRLMRELHGTAPEVPEGLRRKVEAMVGTAQAPESQADGETRREAEIIALRPRPKPKTSATRPAWHGAAMAAGIAAILVIPALLQFGPAEPPRQPTGLAVLALGQALPKELSGAFDVVMSGETRTFPDGRRFQAVASFRDASGRLCREFQLAGASNLLGIACRDADAWQPSLLLAMPAEKQGGFTPAGSAASVVDAFLDSRGISAPLEPAEESAALRNLRGF
ncbi:anti-sigma factor family protein [Pseudoroseomonas globiformis]|uniref:Anti-sigma factor family protein n=1 Tax=Teichococcus globiformis TaxID=2307229 RepID=A0ABV7G465_9PROT